MPRAVLDTNVIFSRVLHELFGRLDQSFNRLALRTLGIEVVEPDVFLSDALDEEPDLFREILVEQAAAWGGRTVKELIDAIERTKTSVFASKARRLFHD